MSALGAVPLALLSAALFGVGFGASWVRARSRVRARMAARLREAMEKRLAEAVLQRLQQADIAERVDAAMRETLGQAGTEDAPEAEQASLR
jgi:hypothetical protein